MSFKPHTEKIKKKKLKKPVAKEPVYWNDFKLWKLRGIIYYIFPMCAEIILFYFFSLKSFQKWDLFRQLICLDRDPEPDPDPSSRKRIRIRIRIKMIRIRNTAKSKNVKIIYICNILLLPYWRWYRTRPCRLPLLTPRLPSLPPNMAKTFITRNSNLKWNKDSCVAGIWPYIKPAHSSLSCLTS